MKWFKHMSDALDDHFVQELILEFGGNGYMVYFGLIELTAKENGKNLTGKLEISPTIFKQKLHISKGKLEEIFRFCEGKGKVLFEKTSIKVQQKSNKTLERWKFEIPKILDFKDNYTKDLQVTCKKPSNHIEIRDKRLEEEEDTEKKTLLRNVKEKVLAVDKKLVYGEFKNVKLLDVDFGKLNTKFGVEKTLSMIESLSRYLASKGDKYKSHYATLLNWDRMTPKGDQAQTQKQKDMSNKYAHLTGEI